MIITNKLLPVALIAALVGGSVGALVMHSRNQSTTAAETVAQQDTNSYNTPATQVAANDQFVPADFNTANEQTAYKVGFADGFRAAEAGTVSNVAPATTVRERVVYRNVGRSSARSSSGPVYYAQQPRKRSFWQKHRDKLTVAIGAGSGAAIGGLIGGKKGAAIGALAGGGGSALWTYKLRDRSRRY
ncbi:MAG TPA: hypothetical protein VFH31_10700 [Pyrinomonadaceae bacterium]|nr:hypothetical protein [Pyrinomonadaceae bacterium]